MKMKMNTNKVKKIAPLFILVMFFFLFLVTADSAEANFGKGWYKNFERGGAPCPAGQWQVEAFVYDTAGNPLVVESLNFDVVLIAGWSSIYKNSISNVSSFTTPCLTPGGAKDTFSLYISTNKAGYDSLFTYQFTLYWPPYAGKIIQRNLYVARTTEPINVEHVFPIDNKILNFSTVTNQIYYELRPGASSADIKYGIGNQDTGQGWFGNVNTGAVSTGTVDLLTNTLPDGRYRWDFWMVDNNNFIYDFPWYESFIVDTTAPTASCSVSLSGSDYLVKLNESDDISGITTSRIDWDTATVEVSEDGGSWTNSGLPNGGNVWWDFRYSPSPSHSYQFRYQVSDRAGWPSGWAICGAPAEFFTISVTPSPQTVEQGGHTFYDVIVSSVNNFGGWVDLTHNDNDTDPINDLTAFQISLNISALNDRVLVPGGGAASTTLEVDTDPGTPLKKYYVLRVTGRWSGAAEELTNYDEADLEVVEPTSDPWLKTTGGDVGSFFNIDMVRDIFTDEGLYNADYLVITESPTITNFDSAKGWEINDYGTLTLDPDPGSSMYVALLDRYGSKCPGGPIPLNITNPVPLANAITPGCSIIIQDLAGNVTINDNAWLPSGLGVGYTGYPVIVFVPGNLVIERNLGINPDTGIIFIVQGNIIVDSSVERIDGVFITDGTFYSRDVITCALNPSHDDDRLVINGAVYAFGDLCFTRDLGASNENTPAELINYEPKYLYLFQEIVGDPTVIYREVAP